MAMSFSNALAGASTAVSSELNNLLKNKHEPEPPPETAHSPGVFYTPITTNTIEGLRGKTMIIIPLVKNPKTFSIAVPC